ncbi:MAG: hypothetical protein OHK0022_46410 [Roseiflexaceae bacterium]
MVRVAKGAWNGIQQAWGVVSSAAGKALGWLGEKAGQAASWLGTNVFGPVSQWAGEQWGRLSGWVAEQFPALAACWNAFSQFAGAAWEKIKKVPVLGTVAQITGEIVVGAIAGDALENPSIWNIVGQVAVGFIPFVGQAADVRDLAMVLWRLKDGKASWLDVSLTLAAFIPGMDAAKAGKGAKALDNLDEAGAALKVFGEGMENIPPGLTDALLKNPQAVEALNKSPEALAALTKNPQLLESVARNPELVQDAMRYGDEGMQALAQGGPDGLRALRESREAAEAAGDVAKAVPTSAVDEVASSADEAAATTRATPTRAVDEVASSADEAAATTRATPTRAVDEVASSADEAATATRAAPTSAVDEVAASADEAASVAKGAPTSAVDEVAASADEAAAVTGRQGVYDYRDTMGWTGKPTANPVAGKEHLGVIQKGLDAVDEALPGAKARLDDLSRRFDNPLPDHKLKLQELGDEQAAIMNKNGALLYGDASRLSPADAARKAQLEARLDAIQKTQEQLQKEISDAYDEAVKEAHQFMGELRNQLRGQGGRTRVPKAEELVNLDSSATKALRMSEEEARRQIRQFYELVGEGAPDPRTLQIVADQRRGFAVPGKVDLGVDTASQGTLFHELAHHIEFQNPKLTEASRRFVEARAARLGNTQPVKLQDILGSSYKADEQALLGEFYSDYVGKLYPGQNASEVVTMGVERFTSPEEMFKLYRSDPEHFFFTVGAMRQSGGATRAAGNASSALDDVAGEASSLPRIFQSADEVGGSLDNAGDTVRAAENAGDTVRAAENAGDTVRAAENAGDTARASQNAAQAEQTVSQMNRTVEQMMLPAPPQRLALPPAREPRVPVRTANNADLIDQVDQMDFSSLPDQGALWNKGPARMAAEGAGRATLESTPSGQLIEQLTKGMEWDDAKGVWSTASQKYASQLEGHVHVYVSPGGEIGFGSSDMAATMFGGLRRDSVVVQEELPVLWRNPKVTGVTFVHIPQMPPAMMEVFAKDPALLEMVSRNPRLIQQATALGDDGIRALAEGGPDALRELRRSRAAARAAGNVDNVGDTGRVFEAGSDGIRVVENAGDATRAAENAGDASRAADLDQPRGGPSGARYIEEPLPEDAKTYKRIVARTDDVQDIAERYNIPEDYLARVKQHLFHTEHEMALTPDDVRKGLFTPDPEIAYLWEGATKGTLNAKDQASFRRLISHEYVESNLMELGVPYRSGHPNAFEEAPYGGLRNEPTPQHHGAHDLSPNFGSEPFSHWENKLGRSSEGLSLSDDLSDLQETAIEIKRRYLQDPRGIGTIGGDPEMVQMLQQNPKLVDALATGDQAAAKKIILETRIKAIENLSLAEKRAFVQNPDNLARLGADPRLIQMIQENPHVLDVMAGRPSVLKSFIEHPEAGDFLEGALGDVRRMGADDIVAGGQRAPTPTNLSGAERDFSNAIKQSMGDKPVQPGFDPRWINDEAALNQYVDDLYAQSNAVKSELRELTEEIANASGGKPGFRPGDKARDRAMDKINSEYGGDASKLTDLAGSKVVYDTLDDLYRGLEEVQAKLGDRIVSFKDRFVKPQDSGYRDILMNIRMSNGHIAEFRLHLSQIDAYAKAEHALYELTRSFKPVSEELARLGGKADEVVELTQEQKALTIAINHRTQPVFEDAFKQARPDEIAGEVRDQARQIINQADNAADTARGAENAGDAAQAAENAGDAAKGADNADEAAMRSPDDADKGSGGGGNNGGGTTEGPVNRAVPQDVADQLVSSGKFDEIEDALGISDEVGTASREAIELTDEIAETADDAVERVRHVNPTTGHTEGWGGFDITVSQMWETKRNFTPGDRQMMQDLKTAYTGLGDLNPKTWATLSARERKRAIQQSIKATMEAMGIPKSRWPKVTLTSLPPGQYGWANWSPLSRRGELCINIDNAVGDVVGTVAHESRHYFQMWQAYQHQVLGRALDRLHPHTSDWMGNLPNFGGKYHTSGKAYFTQPIEADAETFGRRVIDMLPARWPKGQLDDAADTIADSTKAAGNAGGTARALENADEASQMMPPPGAVTRSAEERVQELLDNGEFDMHGYHGTKTDMLNGLEETDGQLLSAADLEKRRVAQVSGEGDVFSGRSGKKRQIYIGEGEDGLGTSLAYADATRTMTNYNVAIYRYEDLDAEIQRLRTIVGNYDNLDIPVQHADPRNRFRQMGFKEKAQFESQLAKLEAELHVRSLLPPDHPRRLGGPAASDTHPLLFEFDTTGLDKRSVGRPVGGPLSGESMVFDPIDLKSRMPRAFTTLDQVPMVEQRLADIFGHTNFEVLPIESLDSLPTNNLMGSARQQTLKNLEFLERHFQTVQQAYEQAARTGQPIDEDFVKNFVIKPLTSK